MTGHSSPLRTRRLLTGQTPARLPPLVLLPAAPALLPCPLYLQSSPLTLLLLLMLLAAPLLCVLLKPGPQPSVPRIRLPLRQIRFRCHRAPVPLLLRAALRRSMRLLQRQRAPGSPWHRPCQSGATAAAAPGACLTT